MSKLKEGDRISNYLLEAQVGSGSFGEVWRARHHVFGDKVAVKIPTDGQYVRNLQREGVVIHGLKHPNIVRAIDLDPYADPPYLIMEYVDGPSLRAAIDHYRSNFPIPAAVTVLRGILQALSAAHRNGLVHRDIKPANILLNHPLETIDSISEQSVRVTDFGLGQVGGVTTRSILQSGSLETEEGRSIAGTLVYMSPEQRDGQSVDPRSDLYSCGIVLFEMLTGERPQGGDLPGTLRPAVPSHLNGVFDRAYTRYHRRFASAEEMAAALSPEEKPAIPLAPSRDAYGRLICPQCRSEVLADDQFCIRCGRQLVSAVPRCPSCRAFVHRNDLFCIFCGSDLRVLAG
jgi:serine/threonine-protein kinase